MKLAAFLLEKDSTSLVQRRRWRIPAMKYSNARIINIAIVFLLSACGGGGGGTGGSTAACGELGIKVFGGAECDGQASNNPVVAILPADQQGNPLGVCTGTLVTVDDILTAAHCLEIPGTAGVFAVVDGALRDISNGQINPLYSGNDGDAFDIAMLVSAGEYLAGADSRQQGYQHG
jgi:hypothetical protein